MVIVYALVIAVLIVTGQALWKNAVSELVAKNLNLLSPEGVLALLKSPTLLIGVLIYGIATVSYILLLSKYKYFQVQSLVVGGSLVFTAILAATYFGESISYINAVGVILVLVGALLIIR